MATKAKAGRVTVGKVRSGMQAVHRHQLRAAGRAMVASATTRQAKARAGGMLAALKASYDQEYEKNEQENSKNMVIEGMRSFFGMKSSKKEKKEPEEHKLFCETLDSQSHAP